MSRSRAGTRRHAWVTSLAAALAVGVGAAHAEEVQPEVTAPISPVPVTSDTAAEPATAAPAVGSQRPVEDRIRELEETVRLLQEELKRLRVQSEKPVDPQQV